MRARLLLPPENWWSFLDELFGVFFGGVVIVSRSHPPYLFGPLSGPGLFQGYVGSVVVHDCAV